MRRRKRFARIDTSTAPPDAATKLGRAVARPKFREETPKTIIATCAGEAFAGTGVCRCFYMSAGLWNFNLILQCKKNFHQKIQYIRDFLCHFWPSLLQCKNCMGSAGPA